VLAARLVFRSIYEIRTVTGTAAVPQQFVPDKPSRRPHERDVLANRKARRRRDIFWAASGNCDRLANDLVARHITWLAAKSPSLTGPYSVFERSGYRFA
jgi:hypothetical protein